MPYKTKLTFGDSKWYATKGHGHSKRTYLLFYSLTRPKRTRDKSILLLVEKLYMPYRIKMESYQQIKVLVTSRYIAMYRSRLCNCCLKRKERQIQLEAEMKGELMPYFRARQITRQSYKDILKICMKKVSLYQKKPPFSSFYDLKYLFLISKDNHVRW